MIGKVLTKQVTKFIPLGGQIVAASLGYIVMKKVAEAHVQECYHLAKRIQQKARPQPFNDHLKGTLCAFYLPDLKTSCIFDQPVSIHHLTFHVNFKFLKIVYLLSITR